ncbi:hypothetical protein, partial [Bordetella bronchiseptica]|uniref:hypothetical protein n=1 Tax=Bordetella bronchiseptica TaxID=518 RepID=UPI001E3A9530
CDGGAAWVRDGGGARRARGVDQVTAAMSMARSGTWRVQGWSGPDARKFRGGKFVKVRREPD